MKTRGSRAPFVMEAAATFGLEAVVRDELLGLGMSVTSTLDRRVVFEGTALDMARCNVRLRTADRVWLRMADFSASDFDGLYEGVRQAPWRDLLPRTAAVLVKARSARSQLSAVPSIQSVSKKAIVDSLLGVRGHGSQRVEETGPQYTVEVSILHDHATVCLDTSGAGLHKRGYRAETGAAPLRENLAAALVLLSRWDSSRPLADPLCGSGTIAIEAAMIARGAAPGIRRRFAAQEWPTLPGRIWQDARQEARDSERSGELPDGIAASDRDPAMVDAAKRNAARAGVSDCVQFRCAALRAFKTSGGHGCVICNPPYGERIGEQKEVESLARDMGDLYRRLDTWSFYVLTAATDFQRFFGVQASKNRKLYNGNIRCYFYQYYRPRGPRAAS